MVSAAVPSPQLITHCETVSAPGSVTDSVSAYGVPASTVAAPAMATTGATLVTFTWIEPSVKALPSDTRTVNEKSAAPSAGVHENAPVSASMVAPEGASIRL
jgi:hypothetical protein